MDRTISTALNEPGEFLSEITDEKTSADDLMAM